MVSTAEIFALLEARRTELGLSQAEVGRRAFGKADGSAMQNLRRGASPSVENLSALCHALGVEMNIGAQRSDASPAPVLIDGDDFAQVPIHDALLSAGPGHFNGDAEIVGHLAFRRDWLTKVGIALTDARVARVTGDSMAPAIRHGDLVLIDKSRSLSNIRRRDSDDKRAAPIFAFVQNGEARVKRIEWVSDRSIIVMSDNPAFPAEVIDPVAVAFQVLGQVVWSGHVWR